MKAIDSALAASIFRFQVKEVDKFIECEQLLSKHAKDMIQARYTIHIPVTAIIPKAHPNFTAKSNQNLAKK